MRLIGIYLRGFCMGAADSVPGISGGTIALITGIYDRLVAAVAAVDPLVIFTLLRGYDATYRARAKRELIAMDAPFLLVLGSGVITAVVTFARIVERALHDYPEFTFAFFFGLIAASAVALADDIALDRRAGVIAGGAGVVIAFLLTGLPPAALPSTLIVVLLAGAIAVSAMVLPGISGSLILLVLGQYDYMIGRLNAFVDAIIATAQGGNPGAVLDPGVPVATFVTGALVGLFTIAHIVEAALEADRRATITFLVGLMVGALRLPVTEVAGAVEHWTVGIGAGVFLAAVAGGAIVLGFDHFAGIDY